MVSQAALLKILADGKYHSGAAIGNELGVSRAAIWKVVQKLESTLGLSVFAVKGKGYRLEQPIDLFNKKTIIKNISKITTDEVKQFDVLFDVDSTNRYLTNKSIDGAASPYIVLAEQQSKGQGRRGREWVSPFGVNLYLSLLWRFQAGPAQLGCLGLVIAVAIIRALVKLGIHDAGVKWPNDIYWQDKKLGGILLEMRGESSGPSAVVVGVGMNLAMPMNKKAVTDRITQPWIDIESITKTKVDRNLLAAYVIDELFKVLKEFPDKKNDFLNEWQQMDVLKGQQVEVHFPDKKIIGKSLGINQDGALRVMHEGKEVVCHSGEVSIRRE